MATTTQTQQKRARTLPTSKNLYNLGADIVCLCLSYFCFKDLYTKRTVSSQFQAYCNRTLKQKQTLLPEVLSGYRFEWPTLRLPKFLQALQKYSPNLKTASFYGPMGQIPTATRKEIISSFKKLETLHIHGGSGLNDDVFKVFSDMPNLTDIRFDTFLHVDFNLFKNLKLKCLQIFGLNSYGHAVDMLQQQSSLENFHVDGFGGTKDTEVAEILSAVGCLPAMKDFVLDCMTTDLYLKTIAKFLPNLEVFKVSIPFYGGKRYPTMTDNGLAVISAWKSLRVLDISYSTISSLGALCHVTLHHLNTFKADQCELIRDNSLKMLPGIMPNVEILQLRFMLWTMAGFGYLLDLKSLRMLFVDGVQNLDFYNFDSDGNVFGKLTHFSACQCGQDDDVKRVLRRFMPNAERINFITGS